jgi:hypothetical protein
VHGKNTEISASDLYYNPARPSAFSTLDKPTTALSKKNNSEVRAWLKYHDAYTQNRYVRKRFLRNPYNVTNVMNVWECDLSDVQSLAKCNDIHRHILSVIVIFSKYLHLVPVKTKSGPSIASAFRSTFHDDDSRRPLWVFTDKANNF